ncbi:hypothetical protein UY3_13007 [Chelonia mydas]|uniref:Uncharacterized protein n=1 Tax=Chelonia mydas TaxID=8469 RepID=M7B317_CHEMY|nr:hypothetical protein UY3_13007 [Chelonia mydas]
MEEDFVDEEEEENAQQASGESILPGSQDLFIILEPIPSQRFSLKPEKAPLAWGKRGTASQNSLAVQLAVQLKAREVEQAGARSLHLPHACSSLSLWNVFIPECSGAILAHVHPISTRYLLDMCALLARIFSNSNSCFRSSARSTSLHFSSSSSFAFSSSSSLHSSSREKPDWGPPVLTGESGGLCLLSLSSPEPPPRAFQLGIRYHLPQVLPLSIVFYPDTD